MMDVWPIGDPKDYEDALDRVGALMRLGPLSDEEEMELDVWTALICQWEAENRYHEEPSFGDCDQFLAQLFILQDALGERQADLFDDRGELLEGIHSLLSQILEEHRPMVTQGCT